MRDGDKEWREVKEKLGIKVKLELPALVGINYIRLFLDMLADF